ncbi:hypothetical protein [Streptomyces resistomycificus]|uniref:Uncharacterized protein n=2 Tax=Streptomyces resistomycificus TaxID=67356 RepID=A0A0L8L3S8_9ACTN|nr:hypothetical protein [Streptomyces resistomycificus]KOG32775.1 hypothetical protein ADK37_26090 [Streptomyces resistomycificus]KUN92119.1 hypothetical protein AQJ84_34410 [Streptomyces resistomycificus]
MSRPPEYENGASGAQVVPNVYLPPAEPTPPYEAYVDPAAAHGWQNAYDETRELPPVPAGEPLAAGGRVTGVEPGAAGRAVPGRRRARRKVSRWRSRRLVVATGAAGAVSAAALIAGFSFTGSPGGGTQGKDGGTRSTPDGSARPGGSSAPGPAVSGTPDARRPGGAGSAAADPSASASPTGDDSGAPSAGSSTPPAPTTSSPTATDSASSGSAPGNSDGKGRGQGSTKKPR